MAEYLNYARMAADYRRRAAALKAEMEANEGQRKQSYFLRLEAQAAQYEADAERCDRNHADGIKVETLASIEARRKTARQ